MSRLSRALEVGTEGVWVFFGATLVQVYSLKGFLGVSQVS